MSLGTDKQTDKHILVFLVILIYCIVCDKVKIREELPPLGDQYRNLDNAVMSLCYKRLIKHCLLFNGIDSDRCLICQTNRWNYFFQLSTLR